MVGLGFSVLRSIETINKQGRRAYREPSCVVGIYEQHKAFTRDIDCSIITRQVCSGPRVFHPFPEDQKELTLEKILELSEDCFAGNGDYLKPVKRPIISNLVTQSLLRAVSPFFSLQQTCQQNSSLKQTYPPNEDSGTISHDFPVSPEEEALLISTCDNPDSLPIAADLVEGCDLFLQGHRKRSLNHSSQESDDEFYSDQISAENSRFRGYHADQWLERYQELLAYLEEHGTTVVPDSYTKNRPLARWVKRQRYQYNQLKEDDKSSTMTSERIALLDSIGFVWDCQASTWEKRLNELEEYKKLYLDCDVPATFKENQALAMWVKCNRRQYKLYMDGKQSSMTHERIEALDALGFSWGLRGCKKPRIH